MPITYVRLVHSRLDPETFSRTFEDEEDNILLFDPVAEATATRISDLYGRLDPSALANDIVVFRGTGLDFLKSLAGDAVLPRLVKERRALALIGGTEPAAPGPALQPVPGLTAPE